MLRVRNVQHSQPLTPIDSDRNSVNAPRPDDAELFVREPLQLQCFVGGPFEASVGVEGAVAEPASALEPADEGLEGVGEDDDNDAEGEGEEEPEEGEVEVGAGEDLLWFWRVSEGVGGKGKANLPGFCKGCGLLQ